MFENNRRTELDSLGEFGLLRELETHFAPKGAQVIQGIGDDAAVIRQQGQCLVVTTDHAIEGVHFDLTFHPLKHLGYKVVAAAVSDICAMNAKPSQILVNLGLSNRFSLEAVEELYAGIQLACDKYEIDLVGGDTSASRSGLFLNVTAIGVAEEDKITYRTGAKPNDLLVLTGDIGGAYMGLQILEREKKVFLEHPDMQPDLEKYDYIVGRQLRPEARVDVVKLLNELNIVPTSMIDVSDGVASEIHHLGMRSKVGFDIYENKLPIDPQTVDTALAFQLNPTIAALNGGEDFELLFTVDQQHYDAIKNHPDLTIIGHVTSQEGKYNLNTAAGNTFDIQAQGWTNYPVK
jgi:thiamine-monophosphate kinase